MWFQISVNRVLRYYIATGLTVVNFIKCGQDKRAIIVSARDMTQKERKKYVK